MVGVLSRVRGRISTELTPSVLLQSVIKVFSPCARPCAGPGDTALNHVSSLSLKTSEPGSGRRWVHDSKGLPVLCHHKARLFTGSSIQKQPFCKAVISSFCILLVSSISEKVFTLFIMPRTRMLFFKLNLSSTIYCCLHFIKERAFLFPVLLRYN